MENIETFETVFLALVGIFFSLRMVKHGLVGLWNWLPWYAKTGLAVLGAFLTVFLPGYGSVPLTSLILQSVLAALGAIGLHDGTKSAGVTLSAGGSPLKELALKLLVDARKDNVIPFAKP